MGNRKNGKIQRGLNPPERFQIEKTKKRNPWFYKGQFQDPPNSLCSMRTLFPLHLCKTQWENWTEIRFETGDPDWTLCPTIRIHWTANGTRNAFLWFSTEFDSHRLNWKGPRHGHTETLLVFYNSNEAERRTAYLISQETKAANINHSGWMKAIGKLLLARRRKG